MAKTTAMIQTKNPSLIFSLTFFIVAFVSAVVIGIANRLLPQHIVLGTMTISPLWAMILSGGVISLITVLSMPIFTEFELRNQRPLNPMEMMLGYFLVNVVGLWLVTRVAELFGLGVTSWFVVVGLAIALDIFQGMAMMALEQWRLKQA